MSSFLNVKTMLNILTTTCTINELKNLKFIFARENFLKLSKLLQYSKRKNSFFLSNSDTLTLKS